MPPPPTASTDTANQFVEKWTRAQLTERGASHEHFIDLCRLLDQPTPASADATGEDYCFEKRVTGWNYGCRRLLRVPGLFPLQQKYRTLTPDSPNRFAASQIGDRMPDVPDFKNYWELRMRGATDRLRAAQQIVSHSGTRGNLAENLLRELIREFLPLRYGVGTGFVMDAAGIRSKQVDILIYDQLHAATVFRDGELVVLSPTNVLVAIEVKSQLRGSAADDNDIAAAYDNIASVRAINPRVRGFVFGYDGNAAETFAGHVKGWAARSDAPRRSVWPDQVFNMAQNFLILPPEPDTEQTRADENRRFTLVAGDDPVVRMFLTATLTAIGVENMRAFFGEDRTGDTISII